MHQRGCSVSVSPIRRLHTGRRLADWENSIGLKSISTKQALYRTSSVHFVAWYHQVLSRPYDPEDVLSICL